MNLNRFDFTALITALVLLLAACAQPAPAQPPQSPAPDEPISSIQATTKSKTNATAANVDLSTAARSVSFSTADFAAGSTVDKAVVTLKFRRYDDTDGGDECNAPGTLDPRADEMFYFLTAPDGTKVVLIESSSNGGGSGAGATYSSSGFNQNEVFTVVLDDGASGSVAGIVRSGTFKPVQPLSAFNGKAAIGTWTLTIGDSGGGDITCHDEFSLALTASLPPDTTPPTASPTLLGTTGTNGWYKSDVTVTWNWTDNSGGSGIDSAQCIASTLDITEGTQLLNATCKDLAGNIGIAEIETKIDRAAPTITFVNRTPANGAGWNNGNVTVNWSCTDAISGPASPTVNQVVGSEGSSLSATGTCTDLAGNTASNTQTGIRIDKTAPTVSGTVVPNPVLRYLSAVATPSASDGLSGVLSSSCTTPNTSSLGNLTTPCTATDNAGNVGTGSAQYRVISASEALTNLFNQVQAINITRVSDVTPLSFVFAAQTNLAAGNRTAAISNLNQFINMIRNLRGRPGGVTNSQADSLIAQARLIIQSINAGG